VKRGRKHKHNRVGKTTPREKRIWEEAGSRERGKYTGSSGDGEGAV